MATCLEYCNPDMSRFDYYLMKLGWLVPRYGFDIDYGFGFGFVLYETSSQKDRKDRSMP